MCLDFCCGLLWDSSSWSQSSFCPPGIQCLPLDWFWYLSRGLGCEPSGCGMNFAFFPWVPPLAGSLSRGSLPNGSLPNDVATPIWVAFEWEAVDVHSALPPFTSVLSYGFLPYMLSKEAPAGRLPVPVLFVVDPDLLGFCLWVGISFCNSPVLTFLLGYCLQSWSFSADVLCLHSSCFPLMASVVSGELCLHHMVIFSFCSFVFHLIISLSSLCTLFLCWLATLSWT